MPANVSENNRTGATMPDYSIHFLRVALGRPEQCHEEVTRRGSIDVCDKTAVALRIDPEEGEPYPVCARHARADMVPLEDIVRFMLDRHEAQAVASRGLVRMALDHTNGSADA